MSERDKAKNLLNHYLQLALIRAGCKTDNDTTAEVDQIVDHIVDAAVEETIQKIIEQSRRGVPTSQLKVR